MFMVTVTSEFMYKLFIRNAWIIFKTEFPHIKTWTIFISICVRRHFSMCSYYNILNSITHLLICYPSVFISISKRTDTSHRDSWFLRNNLQRHRGKSRSNPSTVLDKPWGLQEAEAPRFQNIWHMKVVSFSVLRTGRLYPPGDIPATHFC